MKEGLRRLIPAEMAECEIMVVNSRFIAYCAPVFSNEEARAFIHLIRELHPTATHHVPAFVIGHGAATSAFCSDDGEPSGSSGRPILAVLQGSGMGDIAIVVVRYFGGTKLGVGGLVRAYTEAAQAVLAIVPRAEKISTILFQITTPYPFFDRIRLLLLRFRVKTIHESFADLVTIDGEIMAARYEEMMSELSELTAGSINAVILSRNPDAIMKIDSPV